MGILSSYTQDEQQRMKETACRLVEARLYAGKLAESEAAIKAAMPQAFKEAIPVVLTLDECMARLPHYEVVPQQRIREIATQLIEGQLVNGKVADNEESIKAATRQAVNDARQAVVAVEEYLCG
ncbi:hypothetical protein [Burkholderia ubonensis]|uniref:hypothetical protein n=1 Tax=Burkholderia ubonensis TaxID=101571 RepID=UPI0007522950|nr:hypothetical protein [Burkholderia ubonensis]KVP17090.1 hypothetical protein WJ84_02095 [Burkholderia ubonensis]